MTVETDAAKSRELELDGRPTARRPMVPGRQPYFPTPPRSRNRLREAAALLAAAVLVAALLAVVRGAFFSAGTSFPAVVQPSNLTYLQFPNSGAIATVIAHPSEVVKKGQVLATEDTTALQLRLEYDQAILAADQATLAALPGAAAAEQRNSTLGAGLAQQELSAAQARLAVAKTPQEQASADAAIATDQARLALAENSLVAGLKGSTNLSLSAAEATVARDQAAVASDQVALEQATIVAPSRGVVAAVGGVSGELAGPTGVSGGTVSGSQVPTPAGFSLFPPAAEAPAVAAGAATQPMITFYPRGAWEVVAEVPQAQVGSIKVGESARVALSGTNEVMPARVTRVALAPVYSNGAVNYDVILRLLRTPRPALVGMSADVTLP